jgi:nitrous oxidase accessory protein NosD
VIAGTRGLVLVGLMVTLGTWPASVAASPTPTPTPAPSVTCGSLQALVDAAPAGATVTVPACTYAETVTIRRPLTLRGYGSVIDGGGVRPKWVAVRASDVTLEGFTMRNAAAGAAQSGSIDVNGVDRFTARDLHLSGGSAADIYIRYGTGHTVTGCDIAAGRQEGIALWQVVNATITGNRIHGNNTAGYDPGWEAGGLKAGGARNLLLSGNEVDGNAGPGLWCDIMCVDATITGNRVHANTRQGVLFEASAGATITGNRVWENGWGFTAWGWGGGIVISSSANAEVANNVVAWNADGIVVLSQDRADVPAVTGNFVHDNTIALAPQPSDGSAYALAWLQDWAGDMFDRAADNRGARNRSWPSGKDAGSAKYAWNGDIATLATFVATPGDVDGRALETTTLTAELIAAAVPDHGLEEAPMPLYIPRRLIVVALLVVAVLASAAALVFARRRCRRSTKPLSDA